MHGLQITQQLLKLELVAIQDVLDEKVVLIPEKRDRFVIWQVFANGIPRYLIKCPRNSDSKRRLQQEIESLTLLSHLNKTKNIVPKIYGDEENKKYIIMQYIFPAKPLNEILFTETANDVWQIMSERLASLHRETRHTTIIKNNDLPWIFSVLEEDFYWQPEQLHSVLALKQGGNWLNESLQQCKLIWQAECLVHGDLKFEHCMINSENNTVSFIDWELAIFGDPAWDLAGIMNEFILNYSSDDSIKSGIQMFDYFFDFYITGKKDSEEVMYLYERSLMYTVARLFQSSLEIAATNAEQDIISRYLKYAQSLHERNSMSYMECQQESQRVMS